MQGDRTVSGQDPRKKGRQEKAGVGGRKGSTSDWEKPNGRNKRDPMKHGSPRPTGKTVLPATPAPRFEPHTQSALDTDRSQYDPY